jgi:hypothetical protein
MTGKGTRDDCVCYRAAKSTFQLLQKEVKIVYAGDIRQSKA